MYTYMFIYLSMYIRRSLCDHLGSGGYLDIGPEDPWFSQWTWPLKRGYSTLSDSQVASFFAFAKDGSQFVSRQRLPCPCFLGWKNTNSLQCHRTSRKIPRNGVFFFLRSFNAKSIHKWWIFQFDYRRVMSCELSMNDCSWWWNSALKQSVVQFAEEFGVPSCYLANRDGSFGDDFADALAPNPQTFPKWGYNWKSVPRTNGKIYRTHIIYVSYTYHILIIYLSYTYHILIIYLSYTYHILIIYLSHISYTYHVRIIYFIIYLSYTYHILIIYVSYTYNILIIYLSYTYHIRIIYLSYTYHIYHIRIIYLSYTYHILIIYLSYTYHILITYIIYVSYTYHILIIYLSYTYHILIIYLSYTYHIRIIYLSYTYHILIIYVSYTYHILIIYLSYTYHILIIYLSYTYHILIIYLSLSTFNGSKKPWVLTNSSALLPPRPQVLLSIPQPSPASWRAVVWGRCPRSIGKRLRRRSRHLPLMAHVLPVLGCFFWQMGDIWHTHHTIMYY